MKKVYLLLSILFLATSFTFAQTNKNTAQANKKRAAQMQKQREQQKKKTIQLQQQKAKEQQKKAQAKQKSAQQQQKKSTQPAPPNKSEQAVNQKVEKTNVPPMQQKANSKQAKNDKSKQKSSTNNTIKDPSTTLPTVAITTEDNDTIKVRQRNWFDSFKKSRKLPPIEEKEQGIQLFVGEQLNGFEFEFVSCIGDPETGKVYFTFTYTYSSRNAQEIFMPNGAKAKDPNGELYIAKHCQGGQRRTTITKKPDEIILCMSYVPSSLKEFLSIATSFNTSKSGNTVIEFINIPIVWENKTE